MDDYPLGAFLGAIVAIVARLLLSMLVIAIGFGLGGLIVMGGLSGFWGGLIYFPVYALHSIFVSYGLLALPLLLLFTILFIRHEWPMLTLMVPLLIALAVGHHTMDWHHNRSAWTQMEKAIAEAIEEEKNEAVPDDKESMKGKRGNN